MTESPKSLDYSHLSVAERILLVEEIWDSIQPAAEETPLSAAHRDELHRRLDAFERGELPPGESWDSVKASS